MLGAIARSFGFASSVTPSPSGAGKAYFIERLLKQVIFRESGLAGVNRRLQIQRTPCARRRLYGLRARALGGALLLLISYRANTNYVRMWRGAADALDAAQCRPGPRSRLFCRASTRCAV